MINILFSRICVLTCGTLYPGYISFKTVRAKIVEDYVKWMMYWIVFAIFTTAENFTDIFLTWFPFYYEIKVVLILWLLPTMGNGSSFIYKSCIHPLLKKHETRVDHHLEQVREKGQDLILHYMREAVLCIGRAVMSVINKNFPNGILGLLANNNPYTTGRSIPAASNIVIEEEIVPHIVKKTTTGRKTANKASTNHNETEEPHTSRGRSRKARQSKPDIDYNLNES
ncbi:receptor expression-enhancing protein 1-like [Lucilia sericata]|uniref:receptor expression-enhancing protein 1-like n=1 Tax=Lucilia sericata TaxID=13632 RepID=UPI0018A834FE|nr:receptor expression-enhancing protein 1-like [Lucilia sericata]